MIQVCGAQTALVVLVDLAAREVQAVPETLALTVQDLPAVLDFPVLHIGLAPLVRLAAQELLVVLGALVIQAAWIVLTLPDPRIVQVLQVALASRTLSPGSPGSPGRPCSLGGTGSDDCEKCENYEEKQEALFESLVTVPLTPTLHAIQFQTSC